LKQLLVGARQTLKMDKKITSVKLNLTLHYIKEV
jgi:hypothetical protein